MSELQDLVPPLELCKQIPAGHFEDSALVWNIIVDEVDHEFPLIPREDIQSMGKAIPAPTLAEILREMASYPNLFRMVTVEVDKPEETTVVAEFPDKWNPGGKLHEAKDENGAAAALKLWLEQVAK